MASMTYVTRRETFCAAHKLFNADWTQEKNKEIFGPCANENGHGHNYVLFVTVKGNIDKETGFVMNFSILSKLIEDHILENVDHKNFNVDVPFMNGIIPTAENIAFAFWKKLEPEISKLGCRLHCIKLEETENNVAEYYG